LTINYMLELWYRIYIHKRNAMLPIPSKTIGNKAKHFNSGYIGHQSSVFLPILAYLKSFNCTSIFP
jgi:hypothetical protein